ncbi:condensation protein [Gordonia desulfuricans]|uniref:Condensation protein n=1 Tax=Gordonia desulfuricans TaxID=89051 RepID=A0A7K3LXQ9_9ACTN|nr:MULTISPECIES: condensation domain-containing protein [Gordonia]KOY49843.1 condensation protein [Gordonia sp. NB41Y]NDK92317.1 condensation protein [Gordonia desulfuricans]WLP92609.1 condensation domain-containing protein [Gordonia sp. NB41Y]
MEYTELADYPLPTGRITEWIPAVDSGAWQPDERPLSPNHEAHLGHALTSDHVDPLGSWIGTAFRLIGAFDPQRFADALALWIARHDAFRTSARLTDQGLQRFGISPDAVTVTSRPAERDPGSDICGHIEDFFARDLSAAHWPHVVAVTIEPDSMIEAAEGVIVVLAADHSVMDAYSQLLLITEINEFYQALGEGRAPELPACGSYVDYCVTEHEAGLGIDADHSALAPWQEFWDDGSDVPAMPRFPLPTQPAVPTDDVAGQQSSLSLWLLSAEETNAFNAACKRHGASLSTGAFTALTTALHRLTGKRETRFVMPMHTRTTPESFAAAGWYVGLVPASITLGDAPSFSAALASVDAGVRRHAALTHQPYPRIAALAGMLDTPRFAVSFVDARFLPGAATWTDRDRALRSRIANNDEVYIWVNRTTEGMNISLRFPNNEVAAASIHAMIGEFAAVLRDVATNGDLQLTDTSEAAGSPDAVEQL